MEQRSLRTGVSGGEWRRVGGIGIIPRYLLERLTLPKYCLQIKGGGARDGTDWGRLGNKEIHADLSILNLHRHIQVESSRLLDRQVWSSEERSVLRDANL